VDVLLLGPFEVRVGACPVPLRGARERALFALLALHAGEVLSIDRIIDGLWETPPASVRNEIQVYVSRLRHRLAALGAPRHSIETADGGYVARIPPEAFDTTAFERHVAAAEVHVAAGDLPDARHEAGTALALWRGPALSNVDAPYVAQYAHRLEERRLSAVQLRVDLDLELGPRDGLVGELTELLGQNPLHEGLRGRLMLAQYQDGRRGDALATFREGRRLAAAELGLEPGPELQALELAILRGERPPAQWRIRPVVPRHLPADLNAFVGRGEQLAALDGLLVAARRPGAVVISALSGMGGVGKTALAVQWAHRASAAFPDGQLYLDLHGFAAGPPTRPLDALAQLLGGLGVAAEQIPVDLDGAVRMYRTLLADRRVLVVLDNARNAQQVRPLLPAGAGCLVLVTSRDRLTGLVARDGAHRLTLDVLAPQESITLLAGVLRQADSAASTVDLAELAEACGHLPLALRIAAANVAEHYGSSVARYLAALRTERGLSALDIPGDPDASVHAAFGLSYRLLSAQEQVLFRHLGLVPVPEITAEVAAALVAGTPPGCAALLRQLATAHLLNPQSGHEHGPGRYLVHDLLRQYARELTGTVDSPAARQAAIDRLGRFYLSTVDAAAQLLYPTTVRIPAEPAGGTGFADAEHALRWLDAERRNMVALITGAGTGPVSWLLADGLRGYFWIHRHSGDWITTAEVGLAAATAAGDRPGQVAMRLSLALAYRGLSDFTTSIRHGDAAVAIAREIGWQRAEASALTSLGVCHAELGESRAALETFTRAYAVNDLVGSTAGRAMVLCNMSGLRHHLGDLRGSLRDAHAALNLYQVDNPGGLALANANAAVNNVYLGEYPLAEEQLNRAYQLYQQIGDHYGQAMALCNLCKLAIDAADYDTALARHTQARALADQAGDRALEAVIHNDYATIQLRLGNLEAAGRSGTRALDLARAAGSRHTEVEALITLAMIDLARGRTEPAHDLAGQALSLAETGEYRMLQADAQAALAAVAVARGDREAARRAARRASDGHAEVGYRLGLRRDRLLLDGPAGEAAP
jgi:DNA-binding SARP family transcriptional activator